MLPGPRFGAAPGATAFSGFISSKPDNFPKVLLPLRRNLV
jgi:hypothetical protein